MKYVNGLRLKLFRSGLFRSIVCILFIQFLSLNLTFSQQTIGYNVSYCNNKFISFPKSSSNSFTSSNNQFNLDFSLGVNWKNVMLDWMKTDFTLRFERYNGQASYYSGGLGGGGGFDVDIAISKLSLGFYPFHISKDSSIIHFDLGFESSARLMDHVKGEFHSWQMSQGSKEFTVNQRNYRMASFFTMGIVPKVSLNVEVNKKHKILPLFMAYIPVSREFVNADNTIKSLRFYFGLEFRPVSKKSLK